MVTITNRTRRMKVFLLPHDLICKATGKCHCGISKTDKTRLISSLTIPAESRVVGLSQAILTLPEIQLAIKRGEIEIEQKPKKKKKDTPKADKPAPQSPSQ